MKIANADKLKKHFESVVDVHLFTVPQICTIIDRFSMNMAITDDEKMLSLNEEYVIVPSLEEGEWLEQTKSFDHSLEIKTACCSQCHETYVISDILSIDDLREDYHYCPNCGAWMRNSPDNKLGGAKP